MVGKILMVTVALTVIVIGTYYEGLLSERWNRNTSEKLNLFTERMKDVPRNFGDWETKEDTELDPREFKISNCTAYVSRVYRHRETNKEVSVFVVSGTARHVTIHTPDWCYQGAGFEMESEPGPYVIDCGPGIPHAEFATTTFIKEDPTQTQHIRIFWSYSDDGVWEGPTWPKTHFAGRPALFKVYLITPIEGRDRTREKSASLGFAKRFLPELNRIFFRKTEDEQEVGGQVSPS